MSNDTTTANASDAIRIPLRYIEHLRSWPHSVIEPGDYVTWTQRLNARLRAPQGNEKAHDVRFIAVMLTDRYLYTTMLAPSPRLRFPDSMVPLTWDDETKTSGEFEAAGKRWRIDAGVLESLPAPPAE